MRARMEGLHSQRVRRIALTYIVHSATVCAGHCCRIRIQTNASWCPSGITVAQQIKETWEDEDKHTEIERAERRETTWKQKGVPLFRFVWKCVPVQVWWAAGEMDIKWATHQRKNFHVRCWTTMSHQRHNCFAVTLQVSLFNSLI